MNQPKSVQELNAGVVNNWLTFIKSNQDLKSYNLSESKMLSMAQIATIMESNVNLVEEDAILTENKNYRSMRRLNENAPSVAGGYSTLFNTNGLGDAKFGKPARTPGEMMSNQNKGTGDLFPTIIGLALKTAAKTIALELINTIPITTPSAVLPFMDYVYTGGKEPYGALGTYDNPNPNRMRGYDNSDKDKKVFLQFGNAHLYELKIKDADRVEKLAALRKDATAIPGFETAKVAPDDATGSEGVVFNYVGISRLNGNIIVAINKEKSDTTVGDVFDGNDKTVTIGATALKLNNPSLVSMLENHIGGYTGSGLYDSDPFTGTYHDGTTMYTPMSRGVGELTYPRQFSLHVFTRPFEVQTYMVAVSVTQEQITDLKSQWGIDVVKMLENMAQEELSQQINKHALSYLSALGWKNHVDSYAVDGQNFNLNLLDTSTKTKAYAYPVDVADDNKGFKTQALDYTFGLGGAKNAHSIQAAQYFETQDTILKRVQNAILLGSNWIAQRGRRGPATWAIVNWRIATALQLGAQYTFAPLANKINQQTGAMYPLGNLAGIDIYTDPMMSPDDTRVILGRKGKPEEPGLVFCPYLMAQSIKFVSEGTMSPKVVVKSRYSLVTTGHYPELAYLTMDIKI